MKTIWVLLLLIASPFSFSKELILATSDGPPHMIETTNSGLDIDVVVVAMKHLNHTIKVRYMPLARAMTELQNKRIDIMTPIFLGEISGIFLSEPTIYYRPTAFSLKKRNIKLNQLFDLGNYCVLTFQGARGYFGEEFVKASKKSKCYTEHHDMSTFPLKLQKAEFFDVVVLDFYIFIHYSGYLSELGRPISEVEAHDIFPQVPSAAGFHDQALRDQFNTALKAIKDNGEFSKIIQKYSH
ncbi:substrate-binding periplasmic protein [Algicola sagamiensis]|uniref:substrate-binding periplasmic protein n=1 Tax=Algicola sagamiensis TaxID=163869 RepID=UPI0009FFDA3A|nr:transporter substrate-binding domain-containing protein [Algicola sagamiensis]